VAGPQPVAVPLEQPASLVPVPTRVQLGPVLLEPVQLLVVQQLVV
jgi:hypothetical protein